MSDFEKKIDELKKLIDKANRICVFTGAGISVPSGIPDFRSADGLYSEIYKKNLRPEEIISHSFFMRDPEMFYDFYKNKMLFTDAKPNEAHLYFAELEKQGKHVAVVTQNIDGLHSIAENTNVMEIHGTVHENFCMKCHAPYSLDYVVNYSGVPKCEKCGGTIKPNVVLYEEGLDDYTVSRAIDEIAGADLMIIIGTSLVVYPAASFVRYFRGDNLVLINKSETSMDGSADLVFYNDVIEVVKALKRA
ncbi:MAG: NAD-dependent protein deacylase [Clostridia bacterium]|nr:NAD-dependent protein deacylase [Clostridia bacterium]